MNKQTAVNVATLLDEISKQQGVHKKFIYMSGSANPPFITRYLSTKMETEQMINALENVNMVSLRAGFISSWEHRKWSLPLKYVVNGNNCVTSKILGVLPDSGLKGFLKNFHTDTSVDVDDVVTAALYCINNGDFDNKYLTNDDMVTVSNIFRRNNFMS
jgi:nucleoside-diphosphate-sugar epimerase